MQLDKAIERLRTIYNDIDIGQPDEDLDALKLGIEALKTLGAWRRHNTRVDLNADLPGETPTHETEEARPPQG